MIDTSLVTLVMTAPLSGWASPLSEVPDPVFAGRMMGDGVAIDPMDGILVSPCDGTIVHLHRARHAVTLRADCGAEILIHVGLETVALQGQGFTVHVAEGQAVKAGERLVSFDLDQVARGAKSLITPVVITNGEEFIIEQRSEGRRVEAGQPLLSLRRLTPQSSAAPQTAEEQARRAVTVPLAHGIHARPAARLADLAKSHDAEIWAHLGDKKARLRSPVALMALGIARNSEIHLVAIGRGAQAAVDAVAALIESGMGESAGDHAAPAGAAPAAEAAKPAWLEPGVIGGVRAAPGLTLGVAVRLEVAEIAVPEAGDPERDAQALRDALSAVRGRLSAAAAGRGPQAAIMAAHLAFLDDPDLTETAKSAVAAGKSAGFAWRAAIGEQISALRGLSDPRFVERISDLQDIERQVLVALGYAPAESAELPAGAILLAEDLLPSQLVGLDPSKLAGIATLRGGPTSHVAILAASMGIPALVACGPAIEEIAAGATLLLDADQARLTIDPSPALRGEAEGRIAERARRRAEAEALAHKPCHTRDGVRIEVAANLGSVADAEKAVAAGAEGCGLLRTEFLFLERETPPDEAEQAEVYGAIARVLGDRPLVIRTLDIGGDKPAAYLPIPEEENPALGLRGIRVSLWKPDLFEIQLRAILKSVPAAQCRIMMPMIASLSEFRAARALLERIKADLGLTETIQLGIMVETPAAAVTADILAAEADFLSVGTNDLSQYTLAMDRGNASVAAQIDALHPAVLRLIAQAARGGQLHDRWTGVCGGLASDLAAVPILVGLGVRELSATASQIADIKALVGSMTLKDCEELARRALAASSAAEVRTLVASGGNS